MKGKRYRGVLIFWVMLASPFLLFADVWMQTDWSGGDGYYQWQDPTGYSEGNGVNGWRVPGNLLLFAPDFGNFISIGKPGNAFGVYSLATDGSGYFYAGTGDTALGSGRLYISRDYGASWDSTQIIHNAIYRIQSMVLSSFGYIHVGSDPPKIFRTALPGDSTWDVSYTINGPQGNYVSGFVEIDNNLFASSVRSGDGQAKIYFSSDFGENWAEFGKQPRIGGDTPLAINWLCFSEDSNLYASTWYNSQGARIFRYLSNGQDWELCGDLPDTTRCPFTLDVGYDTAGAYGVLYVGAGQDSGKVFRSTDGGDSWTSCAPLETCWFIDGIIVDRDGTIYAATQISRGLDFKVKVFRSNDMAATWDTTGSIGGSYTNKPVSFHQTDKGFLLVGTETEGEVFKAAYMNSGHMESSVYDVGTGNGSSVFGVVWWQEHLNGQQLRIKVRSALDSLMNGAAPWYLCTPATNGQNLSELPSVTNGHRYIQYRAEFETDSIDLSSSLRGISIYYDIDSTAPRIDTAFASDGTNLSPGIDADDYVMLVFDDSTNTPVIQADVINVVLLLSNGHSWWDDHDFVYAQWLSDESLKVSWPVLEGSPTVAVGDTIYPDTVTITDRWGNGSYYPAVLTGSFDPPGIGEDGKAISQSDGVLILPSVARGKLTAYLDLSTDSYVNLQVFDVSGRFVCTLFEKQLTKGRHSFGISPQTVQAGIYFIRARMNDVSTVQKVVIVR
jgi:hypothetical protein